MTGDAPSAAGARSVAPTEARPSRLAGPDAAPIVAAAGFEGPLDWLLEMARGSKIDLAKLPIAALIQSFVDALDVALVRPDGRAPDLARWGDWLVMAATLTQLRARLMLPAGAPEAKAAHSEAEALRRRLIDREEMRAAADWLERRPQMGREVFVGGRPERRGASRGVDIADLLRACLLLLRIPENLAAAYRPRPSPFWRAPQASARIRKMLAERPESGALGAFLPIVPAEHPDREAQCRAALASTLVAALELARAGDLQLDQEKNWGEIAVGPTTKDCGEMA